VHLDALALDALAERIAAKLADHLGGDRSRLLGRSELAARLGISQRGLTGLVSRGELPPGYLIGGVRRWDWNDILRFFRGRKKGKPRRGRGIYDRYR
jgi:hypothetical protein